MLSHCPQCRVQLLQYLVEQGIALACPTCRKIYRIAEYVAGSPAFPDEVRREAKGLSKLAWDIGLIVLGGVVLAAIFDQRKRRRR
jgi:uncharacterized protein YbaR (Trm112 family)